MEGQRAAPQTHGNRRMGSEVVELNPHILLDGRHHQLLAFQVGVIFPHNAPRRLGLDHPALHGGQILN